MAKLLPNIKARFTDANGNPLAGGMVYTYVAGTSTPLASYTDASEATPNSNPVVLDANGEADIWLKTAYYKVIVTDADGVTLYTVDDVTMVEDVVAAATTAQIAAEAAQDAAETAQTAAASSAGSAASAAAAASGYAASALSSASSASSSASTATTQATNASNSASAASTSATLASDWATKTSGQVASTDYSAKEFAIGSQASTGGSAKNWAQQTGADVTGAAANSRSAKSWAQDSLTGATLGGSAKDWAQHTGTTVNGTEYSAKKYAQDASTSAAAAAASEAAAAASAGSVQPESNNINNHSIACSVAGNALTIALKDRTGADPSAGSPVKISFRNTTAGTGTFTERTITSALSLSVSSGSTLGHASSVNGYIYVYAIDTGSGVVLGVSSKILDEGTLQSSTAEGGAGAADSSHVLYSAAAQTSKPTRLLARLKSNQTTAGTWAAVPTEIALVPFFNSVPPLATVSASFTYTASIADDVIFVTAPSSSWTLTLPTAVGNTGKVFQFVRTDATTYNIVIDPNGSETISGYSTYNLVGQHNFIAIVSDGSNWKKIAANETVRARASTAAGASSPANGAQLIVDFSTVEYDNQGCITTGAGVWKFTAKIPGTYFVSGMVSWSPNANSYRLGYVRKGTGYVGLIGQKLNDGGANTCLTGGQSVRLLEGDYVYIDVYNFHTSAINLTANAQENWICITRTGEY